MFDDNEFAASIVALSIVAFVWGWWEIFNDWQKRRKDRAEMIDTERANRIHFYGRCFDQVSNDWPRQLFDDRVPALVRMKINFFKPGAGTARKGMDYPTWVDSDGQVYVIIGKTIRIAVRPRDYEVVEWHEERITLPA